MEGRFVSRDPIGFAGGDVNLYAYVGNNVVNKVDPSGEAVFPLPQLPPTIPTIPPPPKPPINIPKPPGIGCKAMFEVCMAYCAGRCPGGVLGKMGCSALCLTAYLACVFGGVR